MTQNINGHLVQTFKNDASGNRWACLDGVMSIRYPMQLCSLAAGKDAWMREILFRCPECKERKKAGEFSEVVCNDCFEAFDPDAE